ncbi:MAG: ACP S-malonyltransferase [Trueperaceae bacterium]
MSIAALFPGQGSQNVGMGREFYLASAAAKRVLDDAERALPGLLTLMWEGPEEALRLTENQQPALVAAGAAAYAAYLEAGGPEPSFAAGHSLGEYTAHVAAGSLEIGDAVALVRKRGQYMQAAVPAGEGAMAAVLKLGADEIASTLKRLDDGEGVVEVANLNAPGQTVISGSAQAVASASAALKALGGRVIPLKVSAPFHCSLMAPAAQRLRRDLATVRFARPSFGIVCNVTAELLPDEGAALSTLTEQVTAPVRWVECVERLAALGATRFLEFGSGQVLTGLLGRILSEADAHAITDTASLAAALQTPVSEREGTT